MQLIPLRCAYLRQGQHLILNLDSSLDDPLIWSNQHRNMAVHGLVIGSVGHSQRLGHIQNGYHDAIWYLPLDVFALLTAWFRQENRRNWVG